MDPEDRHLSRRELLAAAARAGCKLAPDGLKRWQRAGLVPRAEQVHVAGQSGSTSRYPPGTLRQVLEVCRRHREERRFAELRLDLWWDGWWVEPNALRESLKAALDDPLEEIRALRREFRDPNDAALALMERARKDSGRSPITRLLRHRAGGDDNLLAAAVPVLTVAFGGDPIWESADVGLEEPEPRPHELVARLLGFDRTAKPAGGESEPLLANPPEVTEELPRLRGAGLLGEFGETEGAL